MVMSRNLDWPIAKTGPAVGSVGGELVSVEDVSLEVVAAAEGFLGYFRWTEGL